MLNLGGGTKRGRPSSMESRGLSKKKTREEKRHVGSWVHARMARLNVISGMTS